MHFAACSLLAVRPLPPLLQLMAPLFPVVSPRPWSPSPWGHHHHHHLCMFQCAACGCEEVVAAQAEQIRRRATPTQYHQGGRLHLCSNATFVHGNSAVGVRLKGTNGLHAVDRLWLSKCQTSTRWGPAVVPTSDTNKTLNHSSSDSCAILGVDAIYQMLCFQMSRSMQPP